MRNTLITSETQCIPLYKVISPNTDRKKGRQIHSRRNRSGCLSCRKRKIKCDGKKPICTKCAKSSFVCVWSKRSESLSHDSSFTTTKLDCKVLRFVGINSKTIKAGGDLITLKAYKGAEVTQRRNKLRMIDQSEKSKFFDKSSRAVASTVHLPAQGCVTGRSKVSPEREALQDSLFRKYLQRLCEKSSQLVMCGDFNLIVPNISLTRQDAFFYNAFLKGFMVSISTQLTHKNLQPSAIFIPAVKMNSILMSVFVACGSAFLSHQCELGTAADEKYKICLNLLNDFVSNNPISGNEYWLLVAMLCLCLREKYYGGNVSRMTWHLTSALQIIPLWLANKHSENFKYVTSLNSLIEYSENLMVSNRMNAKIAPKFQLLCSQITKKIYIEAKATIQIYNPLVVTENRKFSLEDPNLDLFEDNSYLNHLSIQLPTELSSDPHMGFEDSKISKNKWVDNVKDWRIKELPDKDNEATKNILCDITNTSLRIDACERTLLESFLCNYTINLFTCDESILNQIVSPFEIYKTFWKFLTPKIYDCPVPWMNNPVLGAALPAYEIAAKANWLSMQMPLSDSNRKIALSLLKSAKYFTQPILPAKIKLKEPKSVQRRLLESCYMGQMVAKASYIFLRKLLEPKLQAGEDELEEYVDAFTRDLYEITLQSQISPIGCWPFVIVGAAATKKEHHEYLVWRLNNFAKAQNSKALFSVIAYLRSVWGEDINGHKIEDGPGLDALLDRKSRKALFI